MRNKLLVVADLGCLKIYRVTYDGVSTSPQIELLDDLVYVEAHERLIDRVTDEAGRFKGGNPLIKGLRASGERHNIALETARRLVKDLARVMNSLVSAEKEIQDCYLAASKEISHQILDELLPAVRERLVKVIPEDLTRVGKGDLLKHFSASPASA